MPIPVATVSIDSQLYQCLSVRAEQSWDGEGCDRFQFSIALNGKPFSLPPRGRVQILLDGKPELTGWLEGWTIERGVANCKGRDITGPLVDSGVPPNFKINDSEPLSSGLTQLYALKGLAYTTSITDLAKPQKKVECKPPATIQETISRFLERNALAQRAKADGSGVELLRPDFTSSPVALYTVAPNASNVLDVSYEFDLTNQPNILLSQGAISTGDGEKSYPRAVMINELTGYTGNALSIPGWAGSVIIPPRPGLAAFAKYFQNTGPQTEVFLSDRESTGATEIATKLKRKMADYTARALVVSLRVMGIGPPLNTMVNLEDAYNNFRGVLWVAGRTWSVDSSGTITMLKLQLPFSAEI